MEFKQNIYFKGYVTERTIVFVGDRSGYIKDGEVVTGEFSFETFANVYLKSYRKDVEFFSANLPTDSPIRHVIAAIRGAYMKKQMAS
jgi:hypothetical protein